MEKFPAEKHTFPQRGESTKPPSPGSRGTRDPRSPSLRPGAVWGGPAAPGPSPPSRPPAHLRRLRSAPADKRGSVPPPRASPTAPALPHRPRAGPALGQAPAAPSRGPWRREEPAEKRTRYSPDTRGQRRRSSRPRAPERAASPPTTAPRNRPSLGNASAAAGVVLSGGLIHNMPLKIAVRLLYLFFFSSPPPGIFSLPHGRPGACNPIHTFPGNF